MKLNNLVIADPSYTSAGELSSVSYPSGTGNGANGTSLSGIGRDPSGRLTSLTWSLAGGVTVTNTVGRSQAGLVVDEATDGTDPNPTGANYLYDPAGRLVEAWTPGHHQTYTFATQTGGCSAGALAAGKNTNRTATTDNDTPAVTSCYDEADRLTSSSDTTIATPTYDTRGNTKTVGSGSGLHTLSYDSADRHYKTVKGTTTTSYQRDATDRITKRTVGSTITKYSYGGPGDTSDVTLNNSGTIIERTIVLPGNTLYTRRSTSQVWSYPNIHGDIIATANQTGTKQGSTLTYDPYGNTTGYPDNSNHNLDYAWLGQHQRPTEHQTTLPIIEMGARPYLPTTGRFTQIDPIEGGSCNDYDYTCADPIDNLDLDGECIFGRRGKDNRAMRNGKRVGKDKRPCKGGGISQPWKKGFCPFGKNGQKACRGARQARWIGRKARGCFIGGIGGGIKYLGIVNLIRLAAGRGALRAIPGAGWVVLIGGCAIGAWRNWE